MTTSARGRLRDSLAFYWRVNLAVVAAVAICTAVLVGALLVGDSMRGSLRALTVERLGGIDHLVIGELLFREDLVADLDESLRGSEAFAMDALAPALLLQGGVTHPDSGRRASGVNLQGVDASFGAFFDEPTLFEFEREEGQNFPSAVLNETLASELQVGVGEQLLVALQQPSDVPRESLMGSTEPGDVVQTMRVVVSRVVSDSGVGRFGLFPHQTLPSNLFVPLRDLQRSLDQRGRINAILVAGEQDGVDELRRQLKRAATVEDYGLELSAADGVLAVTSREIVLRPAVEEYLRRFAEEQSLDWLPISSYLANRTRIVSRAADSGARPMLPYSTITALPEVDEVFGALRLNDGELAPALGEDEVYVNSWAAQDLGVEVGDSLEIEYWEVGDDEALVARTLEQRVAGIVAIEGLAADADLVPTFPGVSDAEDMSDWEPTFPVDLSLIEQRDEDYWDQYRATPKLFVSESVGRGAWGSRFGELTSVRLAAAEPGEATAVDLEQQLRDRLPEELDLEAVGVTARAIKQRGLDASRGATDFSGLFIGFSLFLIVAAALLVSLLFRLGVEQRASELGTLLAVGFPNGKVRRGLRAEALVLAAIGVALGTGLGLGYAALMMWGLGTVWVGAVGARFLELFVTPPSLLGGALGALILVWVVLGLTIRRLSRLPTLALLRRDLARQADDVGATAPGRRSKRLLIATLTVAVLLFAASFVVPTRQAAPLFIALGATLLSAGLAAVSLRLAQPRRSLVKDSGAAGTTRLATANVSLVPSRSLLSVALVAAATFVIVAVGSYGHRFSHEENDRNSGTGGYDLRATADIALFHDLADAEGRFDLGLSQSVSDELVQAEIHGFRVVPGDDVSCLNLYQPTSPKLLGVSRAFRERGGFSFQQLLSDTEDPWSLLERPLEDGAIPVFGDFNSVMWILKSGLGQDVVVENERGEPLTLRLVGLLRRSIFQSELLMAEEHLLREFPSRGGKREFLIDTPAGRSSELAQALEQGLARYGFDTRSTIQVLESFQAVENTYLNTFQLLGGLGLLLGTFGLAVVVLRSVLERGSELATMQAIGFSRTRVGRLVLAENSVLLGSGVVLGTVAALVAVAPHLLGGHAAVPWLSLALTLLAICAIGTVASAAAVRYVMQLPLVASLRGE